MAGLFCRGVLRLREAAPPLRNAVGWQFEAGGMDWFVDAHITAVAALAAAALATTWLGRMIAG